MEQLGTDHKVGWRCEVASAMDSDDIKGARAVVLYLCRNGLDWYRNGARPKAWKNTYKAIGERFRMFQIEEEVAGTLLRGKEVDGTINGATRDRYILLEPPGGRPIVCLLGARWQLSAKAIEMTLYLHLFGQSQQRGVRAWHRGYRLELPHRRGIHDYTHIQPVKDEGWERRLAIPFADRDVPDNFPAFPLRGGNLTTLCAALAASLYATTYWSEILQVLKGFRAQQNDVKSLLK